MSAIVIRNARIVNEGKTVEGDVLIRGGRIVKVAASVSVQENCTEIDADGMLLMPGAIDDQVHFREPGLTHKGEIYTEARAAVAGGITSFMEMPNTVPQATTQQLLEEKFARAAQCSLANYSFFMGTTNHNLDEVLRTNPRNICGIKIFMGSSTGDMLVDSETVLEQVFANAPTLIATHCEDETTIRANLETARMTYGELVPPSQHPVIRSAEACYKSSSFAVALAKKHGTRLHILHISTAGETELFSNDLPLEKKKITAEACIHHLWFTDHDYLSKGNLIKWNPAVKTTADRDAIRKAVLDDRIDVMATDHAPHTLEEKKQSYFKAPSGGPLVQHALAAMLDMVNEGWISVEKVVEKMAHAPAVLFNIEDRGFIREGYYADLVLVNPKEPWTVNTSNILYKCGWSPFDGHTFSSRVKMTIVNGHVVYRDGAFDESVKGMRLLFNR
ncbi:MAG: dihydroorotase [Bacteroidia bacterium]